MWRKYVWSILAVIFLLIFVLIKFVPDSKLSISWHEKYINNLESKIDVNATLEKLFSFVFSQLNSEVTVYPTENYYYYSLRANGREYWGNIRLAVSERDKGILNFAFWEFDNFPQQPDDANFLVKFKKFGPEDGLALSKITPFRYVATWQGKRVYFNLNRIEQQVPKLAKLHENEVLVMHTFDESGIKFFLVFDKKKLDFSWVLDEEGGFLDDLMPIEDNFLIAKRTQFVFYDDKDFNRKVLVGVYGENMKRNNYFDGPFDQLADNYIQGDDFKNYLEASYPYVNGRINYQGIFKDNQGNLTESRVALTPYYAYESKADLLDFLNSCKDGKFGKIAYECLVYDYKRSTPVD